MYYHIYIPNICLSVKTISKSKIVKVSPPFHTHTHPQKNKTKNNIKKISKSKQIIKKNKQTKPKEKKNVIDRLYFIR